MADVDLKSLLKRVVELVMPNLRHYYRPPRKGKVVKSYASDGSYWADVQPLRNDDSVDDNEPIVPRIEIPILWGGPERGVVCPPTVGTLCDITYYDGDPNYPRISNFRWAKNTAPNCELGAFIIQQSPDVYIKIETGGNIINKTSADWNIEVGGTANITATAIHLNAGSNVVTTGHKCHYTGGNHGDGSSTVTAGV
ncbi:MAG: baseplate assembly protein [Desulfuromonadaceae bacterium]|nr:baseplate assembly protein [Desulfuromonadaceae bacterium]